MVVQVYGLPRSGTNLIQYFFRYYTNIEQVDDYRYSEYIEFPEEVAEKHCKPRKYDYNIFIIKSKENWLKSYNRWLNNVHPRKKKVYKYDEAVKDYYIFTRDNDNCYMIQYETFTEDIFIEMCNELGIEIIGDVKIPEKRLGKDNGRTLV